MLVLVPATTASASPRHAGALGSPAQIRAFQRAQGLTADGVVGPDTRWALAKVPHGHVRTTNAAPASPGESVELAAPASARPTRPRPAYLAMLVGGLAILAAVAYKTLREPASYRYRVLRDSLRRPVGRPAARVRMVRGRVLAAGRAPRAGIGRFNGAVCAITELQGERCFLVRDKRRPRGVWVFESEVRDLEEPHDLEPPPQVR
jgi:hypothetical protein